MAEAGPDIVRRKADHIEVAASGAADFTRPTLLEHVHLVHQSLPELALDEVDVSCTIAGKPLRAPVIVTGMTGGSPEAGTINRDIARAAERLGLGFGVGSQRAMVEHPALADTFQVRDVAPNVILFGNIGVVQAREYGSEAVGDLAAAIGADVMAVHLNPGQELIQESGDRDFRGAIETIAELVNSLAIPVVVKETGCGLSSEAASALCAAGVNTVDVSGAGGTSWVAVEARRAERDTAAASLGAELWDWGIPTAVSVAACHAAGLEVIASGGVRSGLDIARALALGARCGGFAAPVLRAQRTGGYDAVVAFLERVVDSIRTVTLLTGNVRATDLSTAPRSIGGPLRNWLDDLGLRKSHPAR